MTDVPIPDRCVVLVVGDRRDRAGRVARICDRVGGASSPWNVNRPVESLDALHAAIDGSDGVVRVAMPHAHAVARRQVARAARKRGLATLALVLPHAEPVGADEGWDRVVALGADDAPSFPRTPMPHDLTALEGPFDLIGDVHGCVDELLELLAALGHADPATLAVRRHPDGRIPVLLGDLTDRGPNSLGVLRVARALEEVGGLRLLGNHCQKLSRWLLGHDVLVSPGIATTIAEVEASGMDADARVALGTWLGTAEPHLLLDGGRLVVAHAGIDEANQGRRTGGARHMALHGRTTGRTTDDGRPEAEDWALDYAGAAAVVHGHVVHDAPRETNGVFAVDTGCVFGGSLTAMRWPERTFASVPARCVHYVP